MSLVDSLLAAITRLDGEALVMHVGEKPYVVTSTPAAYRGPLAWGQVELSSRMLTLEAVTGMLAQLLPDEQVRLLNDFGAIEYELSIPDQDDRFTVIAARGGDDVWIEVRRYRKAPPVPEAEPVPQEAPPPQVAPATSDKPGPPAAEEAVPAVPTAVAGQPPAPAPASEAPAASGPAVEQAVPAATVEAGPEEAGPEEAPSGIGAEPPTSYELRMIDAEAEAAAFELVAEDEQAAPQAADVEALELALDGSVAAVPPGRRVRSDVTEPPAGVEAPAVSQVEAPVVSAVEPSAEVEAPVMNEVEPPVVSQAEAPVASEVEGPALSGGEGRVLSDVEAPVMNEVEPPVVSQAEAPVASEVEGPALSEVEGRRGVVLPLARPPLRPEPPPPLLVTADVGLHRLLRLAAARAASGLYIAAQARPAIRVDGEIRILEEEPPLTAAEIETLLMELAPEPQRDALRSGIVTEWICDIADVGRVRCMSFRDHRGPGGLFRMMPARAISAEQLGLSAEIQALCAQPDGLVIIAGQRGSGRSTLVAAFIDLINRTRCDHVITLERQIKFVHESRRSFVSQRELRGDAGQMPDAARAALRENPDVLVIEDLRSAELTAAALDAAESGRLVIGAVPAPTTAAAIERILDQFPPERRLQTQAALAACLRGVVAQALLRKIGGGRVAAREVLLNVAPVASLIAEGKTFQLPLALESGRRHGMVPLNDVLAAYVRAGTIDPGEAYRHAADPDGLIALMKRAGLDTSFVERLA